MFYFILLISLILLLISVIFRNSLAMLIFGNQEFSNYIILTITWAVSSALMLFMVSFLRSEGKIKALSKINIFCYFFKFIPLIVFTLSGFPLWFIIMTQIFVEIIFVCFLLATIRTRIGLNFPNLKYLKKYLLFSIPQIPSGALLWIIDASDRYFITNILNLTQTGIYSASYILGTTISAFYIPISFVVFPYISKFWENKNIGDVKRYLEYSTKLFLTLAIPSVLGLYIISKPLLVILGSSDFVSGGGVLTLLIGLSTVFLGLYQINLYVICLIEKTKLIPLIVFMGAMVNIAFNITLIPLIGIMGAAVSTLISYVLIAFIVIIWAKKEISYSLDKIFLLKIIFSSILMYVLLQMISINTLIDIILVIILGFLIYSVCIISFRAFSEEEKKFILNLFYRLRSKISI
jgi:O-antigen/teichoic acid export membrane protein